MPGCFPGPINSPLQGGWVGLHPSSSAPAKPLLSSPGEGSTGSRQGREQTPALELLSCGLHMGGSPYDRVFGPHSLAPLGCESPRPASSPSPHLLAMWGWVGGNTPILQPWPPQLWGWGICRLAELGYMWEYPLPAGLGRGLALANGRMNVSSVL